MSDFSKLFKKENTGQLILGILFIIYLALGLKTPASIASLIDTLVGKIVIILIVIYFFIKMNPLLAVLALFAGFQLIYNSSVVTGTDALKKYVPSEKKKESQFTAFNQFPYTLEQEVVARMAPVMKPGTSISKASYKPVLENLYDASPINSTN